MNRTNSLAFIRLKLYFEPKKRTQTAAVLFSLRDINLSFSDQLPFMLSFL